MSTGASRGMDQDAATDSMLVAELRKAALRAIWRMGPACAGDVNPYTARMSPSLLASMLTFESDGEEDMAPDDLAGVARMVLTRRPDRAESQRDWVVWELERLGATEAAQRVAEQVRTEGQGQGQGGVAAGEQTLPMSPGLWSTPTCGCVSRQRRAL